MSHHHHIITRRAFAGGAMLAAAAGPRALAQAITASSDMGPFYPVAYRGESDADMTRIAGHAARAAGQVIEVVGRVLDRHGKPVGGARMDIWQANAQGRYDHPQDPAVMPLDPDFQGFASIRTGADGGWRLTTVKPGGYDSPIGNRPPHIHLDVAGASARTILQMYFPEDEAANRKDSLYRTLGDDAPTSVAAALGDHRYGWDIVLFEG